MKPIIFSSEMVRAILEGRKTQTRRVVKPQPIKVRHALWQWEHNRRTLCRDSDTLTFSLVEHSPYQIGGLLWVRETWRTSRQYDDAKPLEVPEDSSLWYSADWTSIRRLGQKPGKKRPSIFMPRWASRITLRIVDVRAERVQDISEGDACAEGIAIGEATWTGYRKQFCELWDSIVKRAFSWKINPWVWVIEFKVEEANGS